MRLERAEKDKAGLQMELKTRVEKVEREKALLQQQFADSLAAAAALSIPNHGGFPCFLFT